jgi:hypothetical protein
MAAAAMRYPHARRSIAFAERSQLVNFRLQGGKG